MSDLEKQKHQKIFMKYTGYTIYWKILKLAGVQLLAEKAHLLLDDAAIALKFFLNAVDGVQSGGMIAVEAFADSLQRRIGIDP